MDLCYDTEFLEDGKTIELISIGMVAADGREYYAVNRNAPLGRIAKHDWLMANVVPALPLARLPGGDLNWNTLHPDYPHVTWPEEIAASVRDFIQATAEPQLWAWYGAYDHVALCQLWGRMIDLPEGVPMWTNDLKQEAARLGNPPLPPMPNLPGISPHVEHNALHDAREVMFRSEWLKGSKPAASDAA